MIAYETASRRPAGNTGGIGLMAKLQSYALQDSGLDTVEANQRPGFNGRPAEFLMCPLRYCARSALSSSVCFENTRQSPSAPNFASPTLRNLTETLTIT